MEPHGDLVLIEGIAMMLIYGFVGGLVATRLRLSPIVGFLAGGILLGPFTPGPIGNDLVAHQLSELGVIFLMFGVGLHFSVKDLLAVRNIAVPGAVGQSIVATLLTVGVALVWGWGLSAGIVLGLAVSVASTVVLIRTLADRDALQTAAGRTAVGWLIVEDLFSVLVLVLLPVLATSHGNDLVSGHDIAIENNSQNALTIVAIALGKVALMVALVFVLGKRVVGWAFKLLGPNATEELFTLTVLATALGVAVGANVAFGVSFALGAFFAGVIIGSSGEEHRAARDLMPLKDVFGVIFFVSVGMLFDPRTVIDAPGHLLVIALVIMVGKPVVAGAVALALRQPWQVVLTISPALGQIGEFSFIVAVLGNQVGFLPDAANQLIVGGAILSIALNPFLMKLSDLIGNALAARPVNALADAVVES
jgi:CPA2 family monovalent cation:H+ antiporter-2